MEEATLADLKNKIEKQTGFPSELKTADIILKAGWSYQSNPRFETSNSSASSRRYSEVDFIATKHVESKNHEDLFKQEGSFVISVIIDVKKYSRPILIFSSQFTYRDKRGIFCEVGLIEVQERFSNRSCRLNWRSDGPFGDEFGGRSVVVINNDGNKPSDYDFHQIYSTLEGLFEASKAVRLEHRKFHEYFVEWDGFKSLHIIIPIIVAEGVILDYRATTQNSTLRPTKIANVTSNIIGEEDPLATSVAFIISINHLSSFLTELDVWAMNITSKNL